MKLLLPFVLATAAACNIADSGPDSDPLGPDAGVKASADAAVDSPPPEPSPEFTVGSSIGGQLAIDDTGIRETFIVQGGVYMSVVVASLTETATDKSCGVTLSPGFVQFGTASTSTRQFKTVVIDFSTAKVLEDKCGWDDAHILAGLAARFGHYYVGFAQARFAEDRPWVDVYLNAQNGLGNSTASIVRAGGGAAYQMMEDGTVVDVMVQPAPGTLVPALYDF